MAIGLGRRRKKSDSSILTEIVRGYTYCVEQYAEVHKAIKKNYTMARGGDEMWEKRLLERLRSEDRPALPLNIELPLVQRIVGQFVNNPRVWTMSPVDEAADIKTAEVFSKLMLWTANDNDMDSLEFEQVEDGLIAGFGAKFYGMDYDDDPQGCVRISGVPPTDLMVDVNARMRDQRDWRYVFHSTWVTWEELQEVPEWRESLEGIRPNGSWVKDAWRDRLDRIPPPLRDKALDALNNYEAGLFRLVEQWRRKFRRTYVMMHPQLGVQLASTENEARVYAAEGFQYAGDGRKSYMELTVAVPYLNTVFDVKKYERRYYPFDIWWPIKLGTLPLLDAVSYTHNLHGLQEEKMRNRSAMNDYLQKMASGATVLPSGEEDLREEMEDRASKPNQYFVRAGNQGEIQRLYREMPRDYSEVDRINSEDTRMVSGQPLASGGYSERSGESGVLFRQKVGQGDLTMSSMLRSFTQSRRLAGRITTEIIQTNFTTRKVYTIIGDKGATDSFTINDKINEAEAVERIVNDVTVGRYDVMVDEQLGVSSMRDAEFAALAEIAKAAPPDAIAPIFIEILRNASSIPDRHKIADKIEARIFGNQPNVAQPPTGGGASPALTAPVQ